MAYGLDDSGFQIPTKAQIIAELQESYRTRFGSGVNVNTTDPDSAMGREIDILAERERVIWELGLALFNALDVNTTGGVLLDMLAAFAGLARKQATPTTATVTLGGTADSVIPAGTIVATETGIQLATDEEVTIGTYLTVQATVTAIEAGAVAIAALAISVVVSSVSGLDAVSNASAATTGTDVETDTELRGRIKNPKTASPNGRSPYDALLTEILAIDEVQSVNIVVNETDEADADGRPARTFEVIVYGSAIDDDEVAQAIWRHKTVGSTSHGDNAHTVVDVAGKNQTVYSSDADLVYFEINVDVEVDSGSWPSDGEDQLRTIISEWFDALKTGVEVSVYQWTSACNVVPGIVDLDGTMSVKGAAAFSANNYETGDNEKPLIEVAATDIVITEV